ncbi:TerB family tellurite resistance protein [Rhodomicrobium vannielii ATCC 17100]|uniref:TerB family tellurite resistance protein n=1 Tax=Rhodomicrobium vannielii TaxID=1069 RepID=UPI001918AEB9|nr:TerB family tellurite resistance protein [Rhodomicrobium vannielii]MBJ7535216.1 TerB family tellurite resistance protein [Rhodomicrobium vannielii ATCC 17100]
MSIWGKLAGAAAGLAFGGPLGALFGGVAGHAVDRTLSDSGHDRQVAFTMGVIALGAKMAKADGVVTISEIQAFKEVFKIPPGEEHNVARVFNLAKQDVAGFEMYARQLGRLLRNDRQLLEDVLDGLFHIAISDGQLLPAEDQFLADVAKEFGFTHMDYMGIRGRHFRCDLYDPYTVLSVSPNISDADLKAKYRKLVAENHPDKLIARGVPAEFIEIATKKLAAINAAYDEIRQSRHAV